MKRQIASEPVHEPGKKDISRFKGALKGLNRRVRKRVFCFVLGAFLAVSPAFSQGAPMFAQLERDHPKLVKDDALMRLLYINASNAKRKVSGGMKKVVENISSIIGKNQDNRIFCITLNSIMKEVLENTEERDYYLTADGSKVVVKDSVSNPTKSMSISAYGDSGVQVSISYVDSGSERTVVVDPNSTFDGVNVLRIEASKFFGTLLADLIMLNTQLRDNKD